VLFQEGRPKPSRKSEKGKYAAITHSQYFRNDLKQKLVYMLKEMSTVHLCPYFSDSTIDFHHRITVFYRMSQYSSSPVSILLPFIISSEISVGVAEA